MPRYYCDYCSIYLTHDSFWRWVHHQWSGEDPPRSGYKRVCFAWKNVKCQS
ncbi:hypothetical protein QUC31_014732 [Theobroma cacao]